jgi:hypothetical protein
MRETASRSGCQSFPVSSMSARDDPNGVTQLSPAVATNGSAPWVFGDRGPPTLKGLHTAGGSRAFVQPLQGCSASVHFFPGCAPCGRDPGLCCSALSGLSVLCTVALLPKPGFPGPVSTLVICSNVISNRGDSGRSGNRVSINTRGSSSPAPSSAPYGSENRRSTPTVR